MKAEAVSEIMVMLLLIGMLTSAVNIHPARAEGTIYIRADGSIDPATAPITSTDNTVYTFNDNINGEIVVQRSGITIDGAYYTLQGSGIGFTIYEVGAITIRNVEITGFSFGVYISDALEGSPQPPWGCVLVHNIISDCYTGIFVNIFDPYWMLDGIYIFDNTVRDTVLGITLSGTDGDFIYHNNFINNTVHASDSGSGNTWSNGYPSGGNYWSDYSGTDLYYGAGQDVPSRDGIGDTPYFIDPNNQDQYPLMDPWIERKAGVQVGDWVKYGNFVVEWNSDDPSANPPSDYEFWRSIEWTRTTVEALSGTTITFELLVHFKNDTEQASIWDIDVDTGVGFPFYFISADLTAGYTTYAGAVGYSPGPKINETLLIEHLGTLRETNHLNLTRFYEDYFEWKNYWESYNFYWDRATGVLTEQSYRRSFETGTQAYLTTQRLSFRLVKTNLWTLFADLNDDTKVDGKDIAIVALAFGSSPTHSRWNLMADLNRDNKIDGKDIVSVAKNFGKTYP